MGASSKEVQQLTEVIAGLTTAMYYDGVLEAPLYRTLGRELWRPLW